jgi:hypothetical protein
MNRTRRGPRRSATKEVAKPSFASGRWHNPARSWETKMKLAWLSMLVLEGAEAN